MVVDYYLNVNLARNKFPKEISQPLDGVLSASRRIPNEISY